MYTKFEKWNQFSKIWKEKDVSIAAEKTFSSFNIHFW